MRQMSATAGYGRTERASAVWPSQMRPPRFTARGQRHVVDQRPVASPRCRRCVPARAGGSGWCRPPPPRWRAAGRSPSERVEQLEEEHESRHQRALGQAVARSATISDTMSRSPPFGLRHQGGEMRAGRARCRRRSAATSSARGFAPAPCCDRPQLAAPAGRAGPAVQDRQPRLAERSGRCAPVPSVLPSSTRTTRKRPA